MKTTTKEMNITVVEFDMELMESLPKPTPVRPVGYGVTVKEYSQFHNCSMRLARFELEKLVRAGKLKCEEMRDGKKMNGFVFSKAQ